MSCALDSCPECQAAGGDCQQSIDDVGSHPEFESMQCDHCNRESDTVEQVDGEQICVVCRDRREEVGA